MAKAKKVPLVTPEMRALVHDPAVKAITVSYRYAGEVGPDGLTRSDYKMIGVDAAGAEVGRVSARHTFKLWPALDSELTRAGYRRHGDPGGGMAGESRYTRP